MGAIALEGAGGLEPSVSGKRRQSQRPDLGDLNCDQRSGNCAVKADHVTMQYVHTSLWISDVWSTRGGFQKCCDYAPTRKSP